MSRYILFFCNCHKYYGTNMKHKRMNVKCAVNRNCKKTCIIRTIAQNKNKDDLFIIAKNLNTNNPRIVLEKIKLIIHDNNINTETSQDVCTINMNTNKHINTNSLNNATDFDNNTEIFLNNEYDHNAINNVNNTHIDSDNAMILSKDNKNSRVKTINLNVTVSRDNDNNYKTVDSDINTNNYMNNNNPNKNISFSCDNDEDHSIADKAINANNSTNDTDFDKNVMFSYGNKYGHDAINVEDYANNPKKHADSENAIVFSNKCDNKHSRVKAVNLNVTFTCDKSYNTVDDDINVNNSMDDNNPNNKISLSCNNDKGHNIVDSAINANNFTNNTDFDNNVIFSYSNSNGCKTVNDDINTNNSTTDNDLHNNISFSLDNDKNHTIVDSTINANNSMNNVGFDNNVMFSHDNDNGCNTIDININNFMNCNNSDNNMTFSDNDNANNSETGVVLNNVMIFPYDDDNNSSILNDLTTAKTSTIYNNSDNNIIFSCDDDNIINNTQIACANITNTSEYLPSASEITVENETTEHESIHNNNSTTNDKNSSESLIDISFINTFGCKEDNLYIPFSQPKGLQKKNFCYYCKKFQSKIARHLENVHKLEPEVKKFLLLPKGNLERKKIIETIRRKGNFIFNTDPAINTGELIVCRRPAKNSCKTVRDFTSCAKCKGWFTKNNIRHHFKQCVGVSKGRSVQILGRAVMGRIHECASETVRKVLFPVLREDDVTRCIRYDKLLITFANKLCIKYNLQHQQDMIRARLRLLGRFLIAVKEYNPDVIEFSDIYNPSIYDDCLKAVNKVAHFDSINKKYGAPSVASNIGTNLKQIGNLLITKCIKTNDIKKQNSTENFLKLVQEDYGISINKTVEENITQYKRQKKITLPSMEDIKKLHSYLKNERKLLYTKLQKKFMYKTWLELAKVTLTSTQVFNRRRAGEIVNVLLVADKYVRFLIRGKLGRTVPVILDMELVQCIELILKHRQDANVSEKNPYVFGIPNSSKRYFKYLRACILMRYFSKKCSAQIPHTLRGTELRKHIATTCITLNLSENEVDDLANFMGHHEKIHKRHYRQSIPAVEIIRMTKFLQAALGENCNKNLIIVIQRIHLVQQKEDVG
ncbi:uncharacterized protein [Linepithema humile]|uniref:uncharacterized protein n=1 Tax=Linepithema humile TaxID=83485 RepID=UPI00351E10BE